MILAEELFPPPDPTAACERLAGQPYRIFLDSATGGPEPGLDRRGRRTSAVRPYASVPLGRYSFLAADPGIVVEGTPEGVTVTDRRRRKRERGVQGALALARGILRPFTEATIAGLPPFQGGFAGYIGYEFGATLDDVPRHRGDGSRVPDLSLGLYDCVIGWDNIAGRAWIFSTGLPERDARARCRRARERLEEMQSRLHGLPPMAARERASHGAPTGTGCQSVDPMDIGAQSSLSRPEYEKAVTAIRDLIHAGDLFQANLSQQYRVAATGEAWPLYRRLRQVTPAPFAAFLELQQSAILSASPERFLRLAPDGRVETRPIKGTRPRGDSPVTDDALAADLLASEKDRAENLMIVDLMRNDLSRVCAPGTVRVADLFEPERWATVHHLVSTVVGRLSPRRDAFDLIAATFPGGSITGAPKIRAMEVIAEFEPEERGVYCGSIGYIGMDGGMDLSIAIRTLVHTGDEVVFSVGGGIVADSIPEAEYEETLIKARGMAAAIAGGGRAASVVADVREPAAADLGVVDGEMRPDVVVDVSDGPADVRPRAPSVTPRPRPSDAPASDVMRASR